MNGGDKSQLPLGGLRTPGGRAAGLGTSSEDHTQKMCETIHDELAILKETADHNDGSEETKKARERIQTLALLLDGESDVLNYLVKLRDEARDNPSE